MSKSDPLSVTHPTIASEAYGWDPSAFSSGSNKKLEWRCSSGHIYGSRIYQRTSRGQGCPYCAGQKVIPGESDLATKFPKLAKELHNADPSQIMPASNKNVEWKCKAGHIWSAKPLNRTSGGSGCPYCSNSKAWPGFNDLATTHPNLALLADGWDPRKFTYGSGVKLNWRCLEGHSFSTTIQTIARSNSSGCPVCQNKLVIQGVNDLVTTHPNLAVEAFGWDPSRVSAGNGKSRKWKCAKGHIWTSKPEYRSQGRGCHYCTNQKVLAGFNDLASSFTEIANDAFGWDPKTVTPGSNQRKKWICKLGHIYSATVSSRTNKKSGCPYCANKKLLEGFNDLRSLAPGLANEANGWNPEIILYGTHKKLSWKCEYGHIWTAQVSSRLRGAGCPTCAKHGFDPNKDGFLYYLSHQDLGLLQIGITNTPKERLKSHSRGGWNLIDLRGPMEGHLSRDWEVAILKYIEARGVKMANDLGFKPFDGYTEAWLQTSFSFTSLKEIMDIIDEQEINEFH